jgi:hypothetical protein
MPTAHSVPRSLLNESGICSLSSLLSVRSKSEALTVAGITGAPEGLLCRQPVEGLPTGWTRILVRRKNGNYKGKDDPYYFSPLQSYKFNSLVKVKRFLVCLEEAGGDEAAAYVNFRGGSNAGQTEAKIKASITMEKKRKIFAMDPSVADTRDKPSISDSKAQKNVQSRQHDAQLRQKVDIIKAKAQVEERGDKIM